MLALAKLRLGLYRLVALLAMLFHVSINFDSDKKSALYPPLYEVRLSRYHGEVKVTSTVLTFSPVFLFSVLFCTIWSPTILSLYKFVRITGAFKENICNDFWCIDGPTVWCSLSQLKRRFPQTVVRMQNSLLFVNTNIHTWWNYTEFPMTCHAGWLTMVIHPVLWFCWHTSVMSHTSGYLSYLWVLAHVNRTAVQGCSLVCFPAASLSPAIALHPVEYRVSGYCVHPVLAQNWNGIELHRIGI